MHFDKISLEYIPKGPIDNKASIGQTHYLNQWWPSLIMYICITQPQLIKWGFVNIVTWIWLIFSPLTINILNHDRLDCSLFEHTSKETIKNLINQLGEDQKAVMRFLYKVYFWINFDLLTLGLFGRRVIVVTCVCPSVHLSICPSVCLSVPIILVNTITRPVYPISPPNLLGSFNMALSWMVL